MLIIAIIKVCRCKNMELNKHHLIIIHKRIKHMEVIRAVISLLIILFVGKSSTPGRHIYDKLLIRKTELLFHLSTSICIKENRISWIAAHQSLSLIKLCKTIVLKETVSHVIIWINKEIRNKKIMLNISYGIGTVLYLSAHGLKRSSMPGIGIDLSLALYEPGRERGIIKKILASCKRLLILPA